jgi:hypothetical protein
MMQIGLDATPHVWDPSGAADLPALVNEVREGRCALFVGAGLSVAAGLPDWRELMQRIVGLAGKQAESRTTGTELKRLLRASRFAEVADQCRTILGRERSTTRCGPSSTAKSSCRLCIRRSSRPRTPAS